MKNTFSLHLTAGLSPQAVLQGGKLRKTQAALECNLIRGLALSTILLWRLIFLMLQETPMIANGAAWFSVISQPFCPVLFVISHSGGSL